VVTASDFSLEILNLPKHSDVTELKMKVWTWAEHLLENESVHLVNSVTINYD
jgi:hypothetical protein